MIAILPILAQANDALPGPTGYRPFITALPLWNYWAWLLLPLCLAVSVVYKSIRTADVRRILKEAQITALWIVGGMILAAAALTLIIRIF